MSNSIVKYGFLTGKIMKTDYVY